MKIEMGESLFYSWLRHVKECQIVQNNWKVSPTWTFDNITELENMYDEINTYFLTNHSKKIFKNNTGLSQFIRQGECDALGINNNNSTNFYAVDVAFHEKGVNYGSKEETVLKVINKCIRTAFCLYGYFNSKEAEIIFASPKINKSVLVELLPLFDYINDYFNKKGFLFKFRLICNDDFEEKVLKPILIASNNVADTSELFLRAYQMLALFSGWKNIGNKSTSQVSISNSNVVVNNVVSGTAINELKVGKIAQTILKDILESGKVSPLEIEMMKESDYSKKTFGIDYPLLVEEGQNFDKKRYYVNSLKINNKVYYLCSQWFEKASNNDKDLLLKWLEKYI